jgi:hypothetical protein
MHAEEPLGALQRLGELVDRQRGRVRRDHRFAVARVFAGAQDPALDVEILGDRLEHELRARHGGLDVIARLDALGACDHFVVEQAGGGVPAGPRDHPLTSGARQFGRRVGHADRKSPRGERLGDAAARSPARRRPRPSPAKPVAHAVSSREDVTSHIVSPTHEEDRRKQFDGTAARVLRTP